MNNWTEHDDMNEDIRRWHRRCLIWECVALAVLAVVFGAATAVAVWLW